MDSINDNENRELPSNIKTKLLCMFDLLFCASFYNHLKILPLISCTTIVLKHALLESKHDTASKHKTHRSQIASGELLSRTEPTHTEGDNCDRHSRESENLSFIFVRWLFYMLFYFLDYWTPQWIRKATTCISQCQFDIQLKSITAFRLIIHHLVILSKLEN